MSSFIKFIKLIFRFTFRFIKFIFRLLFGHKKKSQETEPIHESYSSLPEVIQEHEAIHEEDSYEQNQTHEQEAKPEAEVQYEPEHEETQNTESETPKEYEQENEFADLESEPETEPEPKKEQETETETKALPEYEQETENAELEPEAETEPEPEKEYAQETELEAELEQESVNAELEPELEPKKEQETENSETEPDTEPEQEYESEPEQGSQSDIKTETEDESYKQKIRNIITQHYGYYGFAISDTEGYKRFRTYAKNYEIELPVSDSELRKIIISSGTLIDGNVYVFSYDDVQRMLLEVQRLIDEGVSVIYFRELGSFIEDSNLYHNLSDRRAVREILRDNYDGYIFTDLFMESPERKRFRSYMEGLRYLLAKYFPEGFNSDYAMLREYASRENIMLSGSDKALKRETEALKE